MHIQISNINRQNISLKPEIDAVIDDVISKSAFIGTKNNSFIMQFEQHFAEFISVRNCISCANGTDAIEIALQVLGVGSGDEVIVPAVSWISTAEAVNNVGAKPIFVDIDLQYYTIDAAKIEAVITPQTRAIIVVHLYGQSVDMKAVEAIAQKHKIKIIEDCAQAHGALFEGKRIGSLGSIATFSFFPSKNLGCMGDGGCMVTNDDTLADRCRLICNHGQKEKNNHLVLGRNSRLDGLQAAVLDVKLPYLDLWNQQRREKATLYKSLLAGTPLIMPVERPNSLHVFHLFVVQCPQRDELLSYLKHNHIEANVHYPQPMPLLLPYHAEHGDGDYSNAEIFCKSALSLPLCPFTTDQEIEYICKIIKAFYK